MTQPTKLHLIRQEAVALLGPIRAELAQLEARTRGHLERLDLSPEDEAAVRAVQAALTAARAEIERIWRERAGR